MADENTMLRGCRTTCTPLPEDPVPGMAYVPFQQWSETYEPVSYTHLDVYKRQH